MNKRDDGELHSEVKAYFQALGRKGGKWTGPRRSYVARLGGLASGAKRRANAKHNKKV